jgi:DNA topoisomerase-1
MAKLRGNRRRAPALDLFEQPKRAAKAASLQYVDDVRPGIRRQRVGKGFHYFGPSGRPIRSAATLARIRSLVIPPAWNDVWICPSSRGHIQATGRDARGRKQYLYHPRWRAVRDDAKFAHMILFGSALPCIRRRVRRDLALPGVPRQKVLAALVGLLESTLIRIGNDEYARSNGSFGLTTFRNRHAEVHGATICFRFRGKSGKEHEVDITNPRLARLVKRCQDLPGQELFQYVDEERRRRPIGSADVNEYLQEITGEHFTAKDFRTWAGTMLASRALASEGPCDSPSRAEKTVVGVVKSVAARLGNTTSVCRKCYIHPAVIAAYLSAPGAIGAATNGSHPVARAHGGAKRGANQYADGRVKRNVNRRSRRAEEAALLTFLRRLEKRARVP